MNGSEMYDTKMHGRQNGRMSNWWTLERRRQNECIYYGEILQYIASLQANL